MPKSIRLYCDNTAISRTSRGRSRDDANEDEAFKRKRPLGLQGQGRSCTTSIPSHPLPPPTSYRPNQSLTLLPLENNTQTHPSLSFGFLYLVERSSQIVSSSLEFFDRPAVLARFFLEACSVFPIAQTISQPISRLVQNPL